MYGGQNQSEQNQSIRCTRSSTRLQEVQQRVRKESEHLKFENAENEYDLNQTTVKKVKENQNVSPMLTEETNIGSKNTTQESANSYRAEEKGLDEEEQQSDDSFSFNHLKPMNDQIQSEDEISSIHSFMREQLTFEPKFESNVNCLNNQTAIKASMMSMLLDWMIEVAHAFHLKRETFYMAFNYVERYLISIDNVELEILQLIGVTSLFVAQKCEEVYPKRLIDFQKTADNQYSVEQIEAMELKILKALEYRMNPNTHMFWINYYLKAWDEYIKDKHPNCMFRVVSNESHARYLHLMQLFDCYMIDIEQHTTIDPKIASLCLMYLVIGISLQVFQSGHAINQFPKEIHEFVLGQSDLNELFEQYLNKSYLYFSYNQQIQFNDIKQYIHKFTPYFQLNIEVGMPKILNQTPQLIKELPYEEILAFQTHNPDTLRTLRRIHQ